jgi:hypothetical protein
VRSALSPRRKCDELSRGCRVSEPLLAHLCDLSNALIATVEKAGKPTVRQVYALAAALCERLGEEFPESRAAASELIERLRTENGHPAPRLDDTPLRS